MWYHALRKATATDPLFDIVSKNSNHPSWILIDGLLLKRAEDDSRDCPYVPYKQVPKETTLGAIFFALPINKWHTWEPRNVSNTPLATSTG